MRTLRQYWRNLFDIRPGERLRTTFMFLYLLFVLFAYYILKPVAQAMFLEKYDPDDLPFLIILIAVGAGIFAYLYGRIAVKASLTHAVNWTMAVATVCLVAIWWVLGFRLPWMLYVFNIFVGLFSITLVTQGWVVAGNVFNAREAKRVYPLLAMALVIGAVLGAEYTRRLVKVVPHPRDLVLGAAAMVVLAYIAFLLEKEKKGVDLVRARAAETKEATFSVKELTRDIARTRHLLRRVDGRDRVRGAIAGDLRGGQAAGGGRQPANHAGLHSARLGRYGHRTRDLVHLRGAAHGSRDALHDQQDRPRTVVHAAF